jgi:nicotinamidase-related amidase
MAPRTTALLLIGYQNDYFSPQGVLREAIEEPSLVSGTLRNTMELIERLGPTAVLMITTPIVFTPDYSELQHPVGILKVIKDAGAFRAGSFGAATIPELTQFGDRLVEVPGKRGLNAFSNTQLDEILQAHGVRDVAIGGVVASLCIEPTQPPLSLERIATSTQIGAPSSRVIRSSHAGRGSGKAAGVCSSRSQTERSSARM